MSGHDANVAIRPQAGKQEMFLASPADIAIYGGAAGAGKTYGLLMEAARHVGNGKFGAVCFRRHYKQIIQQGGLWDTSMEVYHYLGGVPRISNAEWKFPSRAKIRFAHMQAEEDKLSWDGAQIALIMFDQLEHFTKGQFFYMLSRNRSTCGVAPYVRATCNPNPDSFLRSFMAWWIDDDTGLAIEERCGVLRWFIQVDNDTVWADNPQALRDMYGHGVMPKSFTFVSGTVHDNPILLEGNPEYLANLDALQRVDRERLKHGNWNIRESAGELFKKHWFPIVPAAPAGGEYVRYWDRAATEPNKNGAGSWTAGCLMSKASDGRIYIRDMVRFQGSPGTVEDTIQRVASQDGKDTTVGIEVDPGQAGKAEAQYHARNLHGYKVKLNLVREAKARRAKPLSAQAEAGNVMLVEGAWNGAFLNEAESFDGVSGLSDQIDAASGAYHLVSQAKKVAGTWGR